MKKILFVCKYNLFRSKIAELYFNKLNRNKKIKAMSAGLIKLDKRLPKNDPSYFIAKRFGFNLNALPKTIDKKILKEQDLIIIVANDLSKSFISNENLDSKLIFWDIPDETKKDETNIISIINKIKEHVAQFYNSL